MKDETTYRQELNKLASDKGYLLQDCHCFLLVLEQDKDKKPPPCLRLNTLAEVKRFLVE